jgi:hypothetical protein
MKQLLTVLDVGRLVSLGPDAVRGAIERGELEPEARTPRGTYLVTPEAAQAFKRSREDDARCKGEAALARDSLESLDHCGGASIRQEEAKYDDPRARRAARVGKGYVD